MSFNNRLQELLVNSFTSFPSFHIPSRTYTSAICSVDTIYSLSLLHMKHITEFVKYTISDSSQISSVSNKQLVEQHLRHPHSIPFCRWNSGGCIWQFLTLTSECSWVEPVWKCASSFPFVQFIVLSVAICNWWKYFAKCLKMVKYTSLQFWDPTHVVSKVLLSGDPKGFISSSWLFLEFGAWKYYLGGNCHMWIVVPPSHHWCYWYHMTQSLNGY